MPLPTIPDVIRCAVRGVTPAGQPWVNVIHFKKATGTTYGAAITAIHLQLTSLYGVAGLGTNGSGWAGRASTAAHTVDVTYTPLDGTTASDQRTLDLTGNLGGDAMPSDVAVVFSLRTAKRGKSYRGRSYWAGYTEGDNDAQGRIVTSQLLRQLQTWNVLIPAASSAGVTLVVASYKNATSEAVTSVTADTGWDRQRRRK